MPINGRVQCIDHCIHHIVAALNAGGITTVSSCCGHEKMDGHIMLLDGRTLFIRPTPETMDEWGEALRDESEDWGKAISNGSGDSA